MAANERRTGVSMKSSALRAATQVASEKLRTLSDAARLEIQQSRKKIDAMVTTTKKAKA